MVLSLAGVRCGAGERSRRDDPGAGARLNAPQIRRLAFSTPTSTRAEAGATVIDSMSSLYRGHFLIEHQVMAEKVGVFDPRTL